MTAFDVELDACGLNCPLPVLRTRKVLARMASGEVLRIVATDPGSMEDFTDLARRSDHELLDAHEAQGKYYFLLRKG